MDIQVSHIVQATAGRDKGRLFFVLRVEEGGYLLLADGKGRKLERPKRKKLRHVCFIADGDSRVAQKLQKGEKVTNSELRRALAAFQAKANEQEAK